MGKDLNRKLIIFDFETDGLDTNTCNAVQLASLAIDLKKIEIIPDSEFEIKIRPDEIDHKDYFDRHQDTINWHANLHNKEPKEIVEEWKTTHVAEKEAFCMFDQYTKRFSGGSTYSKLPILGGQNINKFDIPILIRKLNLIGVSFNSRFCKRDSMDLKDLLFYWFLYAPNPPKNHKLDTMREYFSLGMEGAHDALKDVRDTGELTLKFLKLHHYCAQKIEAFR